MINPDRKFARFLLELAAAVLVTGGLAVILLVGLAALVPLPEDSLARHFRTGAGMALAIVIGLRVSRWLERRWGGR